MISLIRTDQHVPSRRQDVAKCLGEDDAQPLLIASKPEAHRQRSCCPFPIDSRPERNTSARNAPALRLRAVTPVGDRREAYSDHDRQYVEDPDQPLNEPEYVLKKIDVDVSDPGESKTSSTFASSLRRRPGCSRMPSDRAETSSADVLDADLQDGQRIVREEDVPIPPVCEQCVVDP